MEPEPKGDWVQFVSERYSSDAVAYRDLWAPLLLPHGRELLASLPLASASRVLDVGSGCGTLLAEIRRHAPKALVVAIDSAPAMLALASAEFPRAVMDAARLGLALGSIDVVILAFVLFHAADPNEMLVGARGVLRSGGTIGTTTWDGDPRFPAHRAWIEELDAHGATPASPPLSNHEPFSTPARMRGLLERAGFGSVRAWTHPFARLHSRGIPEGANGARLEQASVRVPGPQSARGIPPQRSLTAGEDEPERFRRQWRDHLRHRRRWPNSFTLSHILSSSSATGRVRGDERLARAPSSS